MILHRWDEHVTDRACTGRTLSLKTAIVPVDLMTRVANISYRFTTDDTRRKPAGLLSSVRGPSGRRMIGAHYFARIEACSMGWDTISLDIGCFRLWALVEARI